MIRRVTVRGVIVHDSKLLCVKLKPYHHKEPVDFWCVPGGGVDAGEALVPALERELIEETGIKPKVGNLLYIQQFNHKGVEQLEFFFQVTNSKDYQSIDLRKTSHGLTEIEQVDFVDVRDHNILPEFLTQESVENLETQPTKIFNYL